MDFKAFRFAQFKAWQCCVFPSNPLLLGG